MWIQGLRQIQGNGNVFFLLRFERIANFYKCIVYCNGHVYVCKLNGWGGGGIINPIISCLFHSMGTAMSGEVCHFNGRIFYASVQEWSIYYFPLAR